MKRGKSAAKAVVIKTLKLQGIDYNTEDGYYFCRHCEVVIRTDDYSKAKRHGRS